MHKRGAGTIAALVTSIFLAATASFFPTKAPPPKQPTSTAPQTREAATPRTKTSGAPLFRNVVWDLPDPSSTAVPAAETTTPPSLGRFLRDIFTTLTPTFDRSIPRVTAQKTVPIEQFWQYSRVTAEGDATPAASTGLRGVTQLGNWRITRPNTGLTPTTFGHRDYIGLTETISGRSNQDHIRAGGTGLAMSWSQFNALPPEYRLSENDPRVIAIGSMTHNGQPVLPGAMGRLNPEAGYIATMDNTPPGTRYIVTNPRTGYQEVVIKVDAGPSDQNKTDLSPGAYRRLGNGKDKLSYAIASDQNAPVGPVNGAPIDYTRGADGTPLGEQGGGTSGGGALPDGPWAGIELGNESDYPSGIGAWKAKPQCYKHMGPPGGSQTLYANSCNDGQFCADGSCRYVADCGTGMIPNAKCNTPSANGGACLNTVCKGNNAIWDPETKRCGCDNGSEPDGTYTEGENICPAGTHPEYVATGSTAGTGGRPTSGPGGGSGNLTFGNPGRDQTAFETGRFANGTRVNPRIINMVNDARKIFPNIHISSLARSGGVATNGGSQHNSGDALDWYIKGADGKIDVQATSELARWVYENGATYGVYQSFYTPVNGRYTLNLRYTNGEYIPRAIMNATDQLNHVDHHHVGFYREGNSGSGSNPTAPGEGTQGAVMICVPDNQTRAADREEREATGEEEDAAIQPSRQNDTNDKPSGDAAADIHAQAEAAIGKLSTCNIPNVQQADGRYFGCAAAVNIIVERATGLPAGGGLRTNLMYPALRNNPRFREVPLSEAKPGAIIIAPTGLNGFGTGHVGIVSTNGSIISNDPTTGITRRNLTLLSTPQPGLGNWGENYSYTRTHVFQPI